MVDYCDPKVLNNLPVQYIFSNNQTWTQIWWALSKREILETITSLKDLIENFIVKFVWNDLTRNQISRNG